MMGLRGRKKTALFFAAVALAAGVALAAQKISFFVADPKTATYDLDARVPADALFFKGYDDTPYTSGLYYQFDSDNGYDFYCHFIFADMGFLITKYIIDYKLHYPDGTYKVMGTKFDSDEGSMAKDRFEWRVGPNWVKGDRSSHKIHIETGPLRVDVVMKTAAPFYRVGGEGMMYIEPERDKHMRFFYFPMFKAEGTIKDGATVINVNGWGYGNLTNSNFVITNQTPLHTGLRWQKDGIGFDLHDYVSGPEYGGEWLGILIVYKDGKIIQVSQDYDKKNLDKVYEEKTKTHVPGSYSVRSDKQGVKVEIDFTGVKLSDYNDPLIWLGTVEKYLIQLVTEPPLDLRFDGHVRMKVTMPGGEVIEKQGPGHGLALVSQE